MSIPTRLHIMLKTGEILYNQRLFTLSYGTDLRDKNVWQTKFKEVFADEKLDRSRYVPWFDDFVLIQTEPYFHVFTREDLGLPNVNLVNPNTSAS